MLGQKNSALPALRQDLRLYSGASDSRGGVDWLIYDPVRHRYFKIAHNAYELLRCWEPGALEEYQSLAGKKLGRHVGDVEVAELVQFLFSNNLTDGPSDGDARAYARQVAAVKKSAFSQVIHNYLFFRIPLARPAGFLALTLPVVTPLFTRTAFALIFIISLSGVYLAARQWEAFTATFLDFLSFNGLLAYGLALVVVKFLHELGHAYTATRFGVRVNTMGLAFMLLMPLLYTDVTDAWKLKSRRQKLAIAGAGLAVELAVAGLATFLWVFLPDGPARSAAFVLASTSWILSLAVNLNPFMRFDGYYLLADAWGIANLQTRAFAMARWWLREALFGLGQKPPEEFSRSTRRWLVIYAFLTWIYRLVLFIGIALLVYHMFFKVLGVVLFVVEIVWFIALPICREITEWYKMRDAIIRSSRAWWTGAVAMGLAACVLIPWSGTVRVPAVAQASNEYQVFLPRPAQVVKIGFSDGDSVSEGQKLAELRSPQLNRDLQTTEHHIELAKAQLRRIAGDDHDRSQKTVNETRLARYRQELDGLLEERRRLSLKAPYSGVVKDVLSGMNSGDWIDADTPLLRIVSKASTVVVGYVHEDDLWQLKPGQEGRFIPEDPLLAATSGRIKAIARAGSRELDIPYLSSVYGGAIPSDKDADGAIRPRSGRYLIEVSLERPLADRAVPGTLHLEGAPESFAVSAWRRVLQVLVRESGI